MAREYYLSLGSDIVLDQDIKQHEEIGHGAGGQVFKCEYIPPVDEKGNLLSDINDAHIKSLCTEISDSDNPEKKTYWFVLKFPNENSKQFDAEYKAAPEFKTKWITRHGTDNPSVCLAEAATINDTDDDGNIINRTSVLISPYISVDNLHPTNQTVEEHLALINQPNPLPANANATDKGSYSAATNDFDITIVQFLSHIYDAIKAIHEINWVHLDLALHNIFVEVPIFKDMIPIDVQIKIGDLGLAQALDPITHQVQNLPTDHCPLPRLNPERMVQRSASATADLYAFRIMLFEVIVNILDKAGLDELSITNIVNFGADPRKPLPNLETCKQVMSLVNYGNLSPQQAEKTALAKYVGNLDNPQNGLLHDQEISEEARAKAARLFNLFRPYILNNPGYDLINGVPDQNQLQQAIKQDQADFSAALDKFFIETLTDKLAQYEASDKSVDALQSLLVSLNRLMNIRTSLSFRTQHSELYNLCREIEKFPLEKDAIDETRKQQAEQMLKELGAKLHPAYQPLALLFANIDKTATEYRQQLDKIAKVLERTNSKRGSLRIDFEGLSESSITDKQATLISLSRELDKVVIDPSKPMAGELKQLVERKKEELKALLEVPKQKQLARQESVKQMEKVRQTVLLAKPTIDTTLLVQALSEVRTLKGLDSDELLRDLLKRGEALTSKSLAEGRKLNELIASVGNMQPGDSYLPEAKQRLEKALADYSQCLEQHESLLRKLTVLYAANEQIADEKAKQAAYQTFGNQTNNNAHVQLIINLIDTPQGYQKLEQQTKELQVQKKRIESALINLDAIAKQGIDQSLRQPENKQPTKKETTATQSEEANLRQQLADQLKRVEHANKQMEEAVNQLQDYAKRRFNVLDPRRYDRTLNNRQNEAKTIAGYFTNVNLTPQAHQRSDNQHLSIAALEKRLSYIDGVLKNTSYYIFQHVDSNASGDTQAVTLIKDIQAKTKELLAEQRTYEQLYQLINPVSPEASSPVEESKPLTEEQKSKYEISLQNSIQELYATEQTYVKHMTWLVMRFLNEDGSLKKDADFLKNGYTLTVEERLFLQHFFEAFIPISQSTFAQQGPPLDEKGAIDVEKALADYQAFLAQKSIIAACQAVSEDYKTAQLLLTSIPLQNPIIPQDPYAAISSYLIEPIQRGPRWEMLAGNFVKYSKETRFAETSKQLEHAAKAATNAINDSSYLFDPSLEDIQRRYERKITSQWAGEVDAAKDKILMLLDNGKAEGIRAQIELLAKLLFSFIEPSSKHHSENILRAQKIKIILCHLAKQDNLAVMKAYLESLKETDKVLKPILEQTITAIVQSQAYKDEQRQAVPATHKELLRRQNSSIFLNTPSGPAAKLTATLNSSKKSYSAAQTSMDTGDTFEAKPAGNINPLGSNQSGLAVSSTATPDNANEKNSPSSSTTQPSTHFDDTSTPPENNRPLGDDKSDLAASTALDAPADRPTSSKTASMSKEPDPDGTLEGKPEGWPPAPPGKKRAERETEEDPAKLRAAKRQRLLELVTNVINDIETIEHRLDRMSDIARKQMNEQSQSFFNRHEATLEHRKISIPKKISSTEAESSISQPNITPTIGNGNKK